MFVDHDTVLPMAAVAFVRPQTAEDFEALLAQGANSCTTPLSRVAHRKGSTVCGSTVVTDSWQGCTKPSRKRRSRLAAGRQHADF